MAFIMCKTHGGHGAAAVCPHVADIVIARKRGGLEFNDLHRVDVSYFGDDLGPLYYCEQCAADHQLSGQRTQLTNDPGLDKMFDMGWQPVCPKCFEECVGDSSFATNGG